MPRIGSVRLGGRVCLAPMAKYTHLPFRLLCREYGAAMTTTELVSCKSLLYHNPKALNFIRTVRAEKPVALQLFGNVPAEFAQVVRDFGGDFDTIDINCGCSVPKAIAGEYGAFLVKKPDKIGAIVSAIAGATNAPVTVKTRIGWTLNEPTILDIAKRAEDAGASAITLHARSVAQGFSGRADWSHIRLLKERSSLTVIGNGDIKTAHDAKAMIRQTGCDAVQIGRAAIGNAFLFTQANAVLARKPEPARTPETIVAECRAFLSYCEKYPVPLHEARANAMQMTKGLFGANRYRERLASADSLTQIRQTVENFFSEPNA